MSMSYDLYNQMWMSAPTSMKATVISSVTTRRVVSFADVHLVTSSKTVLHVQLLMVGFASVFFLSTPFCWHSRIFT